MVISVFFYEPRRSKLALSHWQRLLGLDPIGQFVFVPAIVSLFLVLQWGGTVYAWSDCQIIGLIVLSGVLIIAFCLVQYWAGDNATIPLHILGQRSIWAASFFAFNTGAAYILSVYFLPIWFQAVKGTSAISSGVYTIPLLISISMTTVAAGSLVSSLGYYVPFMIGGSVLGTIGYGLLYIVTPETLYTTMVGLQIVAGVGIGLGLQQPLMAVQTVLTLDDIPTGTATIMFFQTLGAALAVSVGQAVFQNRLLDDLIELVPSINATAILEDGAISLQQSSHIPPAFLQQAIQVYSNALAQTFLVSAIMAALSLIGAMCMQWKSVKVAPGGRL